MATLERERPEGPLANFIEFGFEEKIQNCYVWKEFSLIYSPNEVSLVRGDEFKDFRDVSEAWNYFITKY